MKKLAFAFGVVVVGALLAYYAASPWLAVRGLREALKSGDAEDLRDRVDFPAVRESVKEQLNAVLAKNVRDTGSDNAFAALGAMVASSMVEKAVDALVTPEGLTRLASASKEKSTSESSAILNDAAIEYQALDRFSLRVRGANGDPGATFTFRRRGIGTWVVTAIHLPPDAAAGGCSEKQPIAKGNLKALYVAEESYRAEFGGYVQIVPELGFMPKPDGQDSYDFAIVGLDQHRFIGEARGKGVVDGDVWRISEKNDLNNVHNACAK